MILFSVLNLVFYSATVDFILLGTYSVIFFYFNALQSAIKQLRFDAQYTNVLNNCYAYSADKLEENCHSENRI